MLAMTNLRPVVMVETLESCGKCGIRNSEVKAWSNYC